MRGSWDRSARKQIPTQTNTVQSYSTGLITQWYILVYGHMIERGILSLNNQERIGTPQVPQERISCYSCGAICNWCCMMLVINRLESEWWSGPRFNIKISSYQYRKSHCGDKTILRPSYLHNGISHTGKITSLYWIRAQVLISYQGIDNHNDDVSRSVHVVSVPM